MAMRLFLKFQKPALPLHVLGRLSAQHTHSLSWSLCKGFGADPFGQDGTGWGRMGWNRMVSGGGRTGWYMMEKHGVG